MRKISFFLLFALLSPFTFAAEQNKLQMVSYFPVPYVAYNDVTVTQFCDVGLLNQCAMNVGPGNATLNNYSFDVRQDADKGTSNQLNSGIATVKNGRLNLNSSLSGSRIYSSRADYGLEAGLTSGATTGAGEISFAHKANVEAVPAPRSTSGEARSELLHLQMYPTRLKNDFPGCTEPVTWKRVQIGSNGSTIKEEAILTCGDGQGVGCKGPRPADKRSCGLCGTQTKRVWCGTDNQWHEEGWSICTTDKPTDVVDCSAAGYQCGNKMYRSVSCNSGTGFWDVSGWNTSTCWNKNCNGVDTSCNLGCGSYGCTPTCGSSASSGGERTGSCWSPYGGEGPFSCSDCGSYGYSDGCYGGVYWSECYGSYGASSSTTACGEGKTGSKTNTCDASCSGATNCTSSGECADIVVPDPEPDPTPDPKPDPKPDCTNGETKGSQACGNCGTRTTEKCVGGKWTTSAGSCSGEGACTPGSTQSCGSGSSKTCSSSCSWGACSSPQPKYSVTTSSFDGAMVGGTACVGSGSSIRYVGSNACGSTEAYSVCKQVGDGGSCKVSSYCGYTSGCPAFPSGGCSCSCRGTTYTCHITY